MSDNRRINKCYSTKMKFVRGKLTAPEAEYKARAFWCSISKDGWHPEPCEHNHDSSSTHKDSPKTSS